MCDEILFKLAHCLAHRWEECVHAVIKFVSALIVDFLQLKENKFPIN